MPISPKTFEFVRTMLHKRSAIALGPGKEYLVESRLAPIARTHGFASVDALADHLATAAMSPILAMVVDSMTTNETTFFRDTSPFESIKTTILPSLMEARAATRQINIWSAACSSGQEPVTIAMVIREHFPQLSDWKVSILATDLSSTVIARAKTGRYNQIEVNRGLPAPLLLKYFTRAGLDWELSEPIRKMITYQEMNLAMPWSNIPQMDIVLMRNVLIYFEPSTKKEILRRVRQVMRPDAYFMLGSAETTTSLDDAFKRADIKSTLVYRLTSLETRKPDA